MSTETTPFRFETVRPGVYRVIRKSDGRYMGRVTKRYYTDSSPRSGVNNRTEWKLSRNGYAMGVADTRNEAAARLLG